MSRLTHFFCLRSDGARALTPTPPSVTSASRVRLFPQYVRRIFPPLRWPLHWEPLEINNRKNERGALRAKAVRLSALEAADGLRGGGYASKLTISEARTSRQFVVPLTRISVNFKKPCAAHAELPPGEVSLHLQFAFLLIFHLSPNLCGLQTALPLRAALWLSPAAACRLLKMATADGGGETVVLLGLGARLAATLNCLDRSGAAAETSPSSWGSLRLTWAEEEDASYSEMFDTSMRVSLQTLRAVFGTTCRYCLCSWQNNNIVLIWITGTPGSRFALHLSPILQHLYEWSWASVWRSSVTISQINAKNFINIFPDTNSCLI